VLLRCLESRGVYVSSGSACAKGKKSHVLTACGLDNKTADGVLRISFGAFSSEEDVLALRDGLVYAKSIL